MGGDQRQGGYIMKFVFSVKDVVVNVAEGMEVKVGAVEIQSDLTPEEYMAVAPKGLEVLKDYIQGLLEMLKQL
jgi:hypothetical protein